MEYDDRKKDELKKYAYDMVEKYLPNSGVNVVFDKEKKKKYGQVRFEDHTVIHLFFGENLERIKDDIDEGIYKDTVLHEIAHVLTHGICAFHNHDELWKSNAQKIGARPVSSESRLDYEIYVKKGMQGTILGDPIAVFKNMFSKEEHPDFKYRSLGIEKSLDEAHEDVRAVIGNILLICPNCKRKWIRKREGDFICPFCKEYTEILDLSIDGVKE